MAFKKIETTLKDAYLLEPQVFWDTRGFFMETYSKLEFEKIGITTEFVQDNHSKSKKWVLRGMHFQTHKPQAKLVRVVSGMVYDVIIDLRKNSPTYGKWEGFLLSAENKKQLFVPRGFAHWFLTLEEGTEFLYKCDDLYDAPHEGWILWSDTWLNIDWNRYFDDYGIDRASLEISDKDTKHPTFEEYSQNPIF